MKRFIISLAIIFSVLIAFLVINGFYCANTIETINYKINSNKLKTNLHFVVVSDQHNKEFGKNNEELISKIREQKPDFIAVCGDMVTRDYPDDSVMKSFLQQAVQIAPTYCVLGNHEREMKTQLDIIGDYKSTGATLLDNEEIEFVKNGEIVRIGGLSDFPYYEFYSKNDKVPDRDFWEQFIAGDSTKYTILLHHQPEYIAQLLAETHIDLTVCGHTHGGMIRLPFINGLYAPNQGFFPKYDKGEFDIGKNKMIITSGLAMSDNIPRINNCAEITVIDIN